MLASKLELDSLEARPHHQFKVASVQRLLPVESERGSLLIPEAGRHWTRPDVASIGT